MRNNYRPISLLSIFDKLLEKLMFGRLFSHLNSNNVLYDYQYGFRKRYWTFLALVDNTFITRIHCPTRLQITALLITWFTGIILECANVQ